MSRGVSHHPHPVTTSRYATGYRALRTPRRGRDLTIPQSLATARMSEEDDERTPMAVAHRDRGDSCHARYRSVCPPHSARHRRSRGGPVVCFLGRVRGRFRCRYLGRLRRRVRAAVLRGYLIEKSLAVDNVFVWAVIFSFFAVPREYQHRVLFYGVVGALLLRGIFIAGGAALISNFAWILYLFAAFLIVTGIKMAVQRNSHIDPSTSRTLRLFRRTVPMTDAYHGQKFLIRRRGVLMATPLLAVLVLVEVTDVIFAVDSIPAIFAVTDEAFIVFTANAFAILGLRAMYFLLADIMHRFVYLKVGLALVLVWVGIKMALKVDVFYIPTTISLAVIVTLIGGSVIASLVATRGKASADGADRSTTQPFRMATDAELKDTEPLLRRGKRPSNTDRGPRSGGR